MRSMVEGHAELESRLPDVPLHHPAGGPLPGTRRIALGIP